MANNEGVADHASEGVATNDGVTDHAVEGVATDDGIAHDASEGVDASWDDDEALTWEEALNKAFAPDKAGIRESVGHGVSMQANAVVRWSLEFR